MHKTIDETCANRVGDKGEDDRNATGHLQERSDGSARMGQNDVWNERDQFCRVLAHIVGITGGPAIIDPKVLADGPARLLETLSKCREAHL